MKIKKLFLRFRETVRPAENFYRCFFYRIKNRDNLSLTMAVFGKKQFIVILLSLG